MTRILVIGGPGSGKTTLAKLLAAQLTLPFYELDVIGWEGGYGAERSEAERLHDVHQIAIQPSWVVEGSFIGWTDELFASADQIIWLDLPWRTARYRIIMRHLRASLAGTNRHPGIRKLYHFLQGVQRFYSNPTPMDWNRAAQAEHLQAYSRKVIQCRQPSEVKALVRRLLTQPEHAA